MVLVCLIGVTGKYLPVSLLKFVYYLTSSHCFGGFKPSIRSLFACESFMLHLGVLIIRALLFDKQRLSLQLVMNTA